jgi:hypothetical protein
MNDLILLNSSAAETGYNSSLPVGKQALKLIAKINDVVIPASFSFGQRREQNLIQLCRASAFVFS